MRTRYYVVVTGFFKLSIIINISRFFMDSRMNDKRINLIAKDPTFTLQNDIAALSNAFAIPKINYVDISRQEHMNEVIRRWPLLAELTQLTGRVR